MNNAAKQINDHKFSQVVNIDIKRSTFNRNSGKKTSFNAGYLVPVYLDEVLPGDTFDMKMSFVSRLTTPIYPTMDNLDLEFFAFYCPNRVLWSGWEELNGENKSSAWVPSSPPSSVPQISSGVVKSGSVYDYLGLPVGLDLSKYPVSFLPLRFYFRIFNDWFRDQNFQAPTISTTGAPISMPGQPGVIEPNSLFPVNKPHDYFSSCLPAPQKGSSQLIPIELNQLIPVITRYATHNGSTLKAGESSISNLKWVSQATGNEASQGQLNASNRGAVTFASSEPTGSVDNPVVPANLYANVS